jgi:hypothetical protein
MPIKLVKITLSLLALVALLLAGIAAAAPSKSHRTARIVPVFPHCGWPVESTPSLANEEGPDPNATYWTTPFENNGTVRSLTIKGTYPTARFMSFVAYNYLGDDFTATTDGKTVESAIADYKIAPDPGSVNPWQVNSVPTGKSTNFTVRLRRGVTPGLQQRLNEIPLVDPNHPEPTTVQPALAPEDVGFLTMRTYIPSGGNKTVKLPTVIVNHVVERHGKRRIAHTALPTCNAERLAHAVKAKKDLKKIIAKIKGEATATTQVTPCAVEGVPRYSNGCGKPLEWEQASTDQIGGLFPNPSNAYISMYFYPSPGTVVVTRGLMPTTPLAAGSGSLGDSIGATPVNWTASPLPYQLRYWSVNNYLIKEPYPVVTQGAGPNRTYGGTADYQTAINSNGQYTVVSSLPADKPSEASLGANSATWIAMQGDQPGIAETQWMRNMMGENFAYSIQQVPKAPLPTEYVPASVVAQAMGPYYPASAQCQVATFEAGGASACFAANSPATGPSAG